MVSNICNLCSFHKEGNHIAKLGRTDEIATVACKCILILGSTGYMVYRALKGQ
jgi:hypothetical protein